MRWQHPQRGLVPPDSFIPLAEDTGLIVQMGAWALHCACVAVVGWNTKRSTPLKVAVNLSVKQFGDPNFVTMVRDALDATGCKGEWLELEITESLLLDARDEIVQILEALTDMGITIAIDDFGIGYSALSYLTRLPVQTLKIDRSFVKGLPLDKSSAELVKAISSLGRSLNMVLVAEGVETVEQAQHLTGLGCDLVQGYLFGKPVPLDVFIQIANKAAQDITPASVTAI
jgi:EAL domain-containing protein (putative c-di-GMP-specific phosphodiesterase class I)